MSDVQKNLAAILRRAAKRLRGQDCWASWLSVGKAYNLLAWA